VSERAAPTLNKPLDAVAGRLDRWPRSGCDSAPPRRACHHAWRTNPDLCAPQPHGRYPTL